LHDYHLPGAVAPACFHMSEVLAFILIVLLFYGCGFLSAFCDKESRCTFDRKTLRSGLSIGGVINILIFTMVFLMSFHTGVTGPVRLARANAWTRPGAWVDDTCKVLAVGIASRGRCYADDAASLGIDSYSVCPGWTQCSAEEGQCKCSGDVAFGSGLYGRGDSPDWKGTVRKQGIDGSINCTSVAFGSDPAPYIPKYCWCLSSARLDLIAQSKVGSVDQQRCELEGDRAYTRVADRSTVAAEEVDPIRLSSGFSEAHRGSINPTPEFDAELIEDKENEEKDEADESLPGQIELLETGDGYDNRRRGGCKSVYSPWALVKVSAGDFAAGERTRLRCAYSYGAEILSREEQKDTAESLYQSWEQAATGMEIPCTAHDDCTIALSPLESLARDEGVKTQNAWTTAWQGLFVACMVSTVSGIVAVCWERDNGAPGISPEEFMVYAALNVLINVIVVAILIWKDIAGTGLVDALVFCLSVLSAALLQCGWPLLIIRFLHASGADMFARESRHRNLQAASPPARVLIRRASTLRTAVTGGRSLHNGDVVILTVAVGNLPADTLGRVVGLDGANIIFMDEGGETAQVVQNQLRLAAY